MLREKRELDGEGRLAWPRESGGKRVFARNPGRDLQALDWLPLEKKALDDLIAFHQEKRYHQKKNKKKGGPRHTKRITFTQPVAKGKNFSSIETAMEKGCTKKLWKR